MIRFLCFTLCCLATLTRAGNLPENLPAGIAGEVAAIDRLRILSAAAAALGATPFTITRFPAKNSPGGLHDFYSNADYWWPDPAKADGRPYIQRDGQSNPGNFTAHRLAMRGLRDAVAALGAAYKITGDERYAQKAAGLLQVFFLAEKTRMNPALDYAQTVPGRGNGQPWGIIDALHLIEIPPAIAAMEKSPAFTPELMAGLQHWFAALADWMITSPNGRAEAVAKNNHAVALARTKPYGYSIFQLDNLTALCQVLSTPGDNLWTFELPDGRGIRRAAAFLYPFLADKSKWPLQPDVQAWADWPARQPGLLFAGLALDEPRYVELWKKLPPDPANPEVRRNLAITQPILWLSDAK